MQHQHHNGKDDGLSTEIMVRQLPSSLFQSHGLSDRAVVFVFEKIVRDKKKNRAWD